MMKSRKQYINKIKRVVVKIGSSSLTSKKGGLDLENMAGLIRQVKELSQKGMEIISGAFSMDTFSGADLIVVSPGISLERSPFASLRDRKVELIGELELAWLNLKGKVIAITGTKGKSTTASLLREALSEEGFPVRLGGNIGEPLISLVNGSNEEFYFVVEVSSFQLETVRDFHPFIAALLNFSPDHLDRYSDMKAYREAKVRIFENQKEGDCSVVNFDDPEAVEMACMSKGRLYFFSGKGELPRGREGAFLKGGEFIIRMGGEESKLIGSRALKLRGTHNMENVLAACVMAGLVGVSPPSMIKAFSGFKGLEHAFELVGETGGIRFINDSKATNVMAALRGLESVEGPVVLIMGGKSKGGDFMMLKEEVERKVKHIVLIGEASSLIEERLSGVRPCRFCDTLQEAIRTAYRLAGEGDTVLFSPACASFDMFRNYQDRGNAFKDEVFRLSGSAGKGSDDGS